MINGFEEQTSPLSEYERDVLLPLVVRGLRLKVGRENAVTNKEMCAGLGRHGYEVSGARIRKLIHHIRTEGLVIGLVATSGGYYVATEKDEIVSYVRSLEGRETAIRRVREVLIAQLAFLNNC